MLGRILEASHELPPDDLPVLLRHEVVRAGFADFAVYLADHEQQVLNPLEAGDVLPVDNSLAGRAYQSEEALEGEGAAGARRLWVPLRDGVERLGVVSFDASSFPQDLADRCEHVATVAAELVMSKLQYGDSLVRIRRREPFTLAAELRWALLPPLSFTTPRAAVACALAPPHEVAGDAFDYALNGEDLHVAVFDAMGHGVEAARLGNLAVAAYRNARRGEADLEATYRTIDQAIVAEFPAAQFVTAQLTVLDAETGGLRWINAGHPRPLLIRDGRVQGPLEGAPSLPLGIANRPPVVHEDALQPGDHVLFFSDGLIEARSNTGEAFGESRLVDVIARAFSETHTLSEAVRRLMSAVLSHQDGPLQDDATIALLHWSGPSS